ncbi:MAG: GAK system CofD-like protein [gamma proteobacterium symbiont of Lucinoma myriamae]|nr:GAK system CofD-like protein [gamma proteobacterium symbiont of Lucinoma myriamae]MCU7818627.1 GAK system CofD-like protein [gamma proteobacterium symbiont of Lucinoma myriamae]MCU7833504.1 GAK system CofD-like protein [gamma proteobacterium symbiont of Lucinoma myriamae]
MKTIKITRTALIPDPIRISRYQKVPELGPDILFFSGGSALNGLSKHLKNFTYNSTHMVTPFDSGGSSAKLRQAFDMPAIGDLRSRLMALANETITGHPEVYRLFTYRLSTQQSQKALSQQLMNLVDGKDALIKAIPNPMRRLIRNLLGVFIQHRPKNFDLKGASIGNLALAGGYLNNHRHLDPVIFLFSKLVGVQGTVRAVVNDNLHLAAELKSGEMVVGQHRLTGKEVRPIQSKIKRLMLSSHPDKYIPAVSRIRNKNYKLIRNAELICFPPGSFYSSLIANLLPEGVASAIADNRNPKIFIPNLGNDPEQFGLSLKDSVDSLLAVMERSCPEASTNELLNLILLDSKNGNYKGSLPVALKKKGIEIIDTKLISSKSAPYYDPALLTNALLSLV